MRGEVEIIEGFDGDHPFCVMHWDRHRDAGWSVQFFRERRNALVFARAYANEFGLDLHSAEIIQFEVQQ